jgi:DNA-directed RNA polymerase specialized sigma24 family protein
MARQIYVNLPIKNMERTQAFFAALGFSFNPQFTNDQGACMVVSDPPTVPSRPSGASNRPSIVASVARMVRDVGLAEELAQDALVAALEHWPRRRHPRQPGRLADDHRQAPRARPAAPAQDARAQARRARRRPRARCRPTWCPTSSTHSTPRAQDDIGDDLLRLIFTACHPVLSTEARVALTLRLLGGLSTDEIARAFLVPEPTIAQRIVRAKRTLTKPACPSRCPAARAPAAPGLGAGGDLPDLQRRLCRHRGRRLDAPGAVRGSAAPGPHAGRICARRSRGARPAGADGAAGLAHRGAHRRRRAARCCCWSRTAARWDPCC